jgi:hypothetical protein
VKRRFTLWQAIRWLAEQWTGGDVLEVWRRALPARNLHEVAATTVPLPNLVSKAEGLLVVFDSLPRGRQSTGTQVTITRTGNKPFALAVRRETGSTRWDKQHSQEEVLVGDMAFDDAFYIQGDAARVLAALDAATRNEIRQLAETADLVISGHRIVFSLGATDEPWLSLVLARVFDLAKQLNDEAPCIDRLARNAVQDPAAGVRLRNLIVLTREYGSQDVARTALRSALGDADAHVRLNAALALGEDGRAVLEQLAGDGKIADAYSARAIGALAAELPVDRLRAILLASLPGPRPLTGAACIEALGSRGGDDAVAAVCDVLYHEDQELRVAAAHALGRHEGPRAEQALCGVLGAATEPDELDAAIESLGRMGTVGSVPVLEALAREHPWSLSLHRAVRQSIAEIQSRLVGAEHGQVSLANAQGGEVSLAADEGGLSLAPDARRPG